METPKWIFLESSWILRIHWISCSGVVFGSRRAWKSAGRILRMRSKRLGTHKQFHSWFVYVVNSSKKHSQSSQFRDIKSDSPNSGWCLPKIASRNWMLSTQTDQNLLISAPQLAHSIAVPPGARRAWCAKATSDDMAQSNIRWSWQNMWFDLRPPLANRWADSHWFSTEPWISSFPIVLPMV